MALLVAQKITLAGVAPAYVATAGGGDTFLNNGKTTLTFKNGDIVPTTITVNSAQLCSHGFEHDINITVPAGGSIAVGPFNPTRFNDENGLVNLAYTGVTTLTVALVTT